MTIHVARCHYSAYYLSQMQRGAAEDKPMSQTFSFAGISFTKSAMENVEAMGMSEADVRRDVLDICSGEHSRESLLKKCLAGAEEADAIEGWNDYVSSVVVAAELKMEPMSVITMQEAVAQYRAGNDAGNGFAPAGVADLVGGCIAALKGEGYTVVLTSSSTSDVDVLESPEGKLIAIGGDERGRGAWAVEIKA